MKHITCEIYKPVSGDCSNNGTSARTNRIYLFAEGAAERDIIVFCIANGIPEDICYRVARRKGAFVNGKCLRPDHVFAERVFKDGKWYMHGGAFAYTCDSRMAELTGVHYPIAIHDRTEW